jgi:hypothetical protein
VRTRAEGFDSVSDRDRDEDRGLPLHGVI